jgi:hypothetical protein
MVALFQQRQYHLPTGVVGVGDQEDLSVQDIRDRQKQVHELVQETSLISVGKDQSLVNAASQRDRDKLS